MNTLAHCIAAIMHEMRIYSAHSRHLSSSLQLAVYLHASPSSLHPTPTFFASQIAMSTPTQQKVLFLQEKQGSCAVSSSDVPKPSAGELLIKNEAAGLNPVDWKIQAFGLFVKTYPAILGLDAAGTVEAVGEGVTTFKKGDRVLYEGFLDNKLATFQQYTVIAASLAAKVGQHDPGSAAIAQEWTR